ncbi:hypothetical protein OC846_000733 [Tilletia horrida]|uniref:Uncharacterized protein n=1 Tax=Tilletia horrida TaxID=155126 RepID=A0AAN6GXC4_9BASI|nr:hypothetical protein OC845_001029 [Tilletia horrida]KAK0557086.1 hypothetical protein OC846_000733 [Tilletia horrida]
MRTFLSTSVALLAVGSSLAAAHPHAPVEQADASLERRSPEPLVLGTGHNNALGNGDGVDSLVYSLGLDKRKATKVKQVSDQDGLDLKGMKIVTNWANDFEKRDPHRKITLVSDNDGIDAKKAKVVTNMFNDFEKRDPHRKITLVQDSDLVDAKGMKIVTNLFNDFEKRKATKITQVVDDDLIDAKGMKVVTNMFNDFEKRDPHRKITQLVDDDLVDAKGMKVVTNIGNDFEKRDPHRKVTQIFDDDLIDAKGAKIVTNWANDFEKRKATKITQVADNDLIDAKGMKIEFNALNDFERRSTAADEAQEGDALLARDSESSSAAERRSFFSYSENDILDLSNMGVNLNLLNGKSHYCISLPHTFHYQPSSYYKSHHHRPSSRPNYYKSNGHYHHSCPSNYKHVSYQSTCGSAYYSDNDLVDLKDTSFNVCILNLGGSCSNHADNAPRWKCTSRHGCCVRRNSHAYYASHHHKSGTTVVHDNDGLDLKGSKVNINALNLGDKKAGSNGVLGTGLLTGGTGLL